MGYLPKQGIRVELVEFASGGRAVQGCVLKPDRRFFDEGGSAAVLVHGVESYWYSGPSMFLACALAAAGYTTLSYNGIHSGETYRNSEFETAVKEVADAVSFMKSRGFGAIFLAGHSLGTPIVEYCQGDDPDVAVKALGLYGPHIDIPAVTRESLLGPELYDRFAEECRALAADRKGDEIRLLPFREGKVIITSAKTFLSYRDVESSKAAVKNMVRRISVPLLIVYDPADNIQGRGSLISRAAIVAKIEENAVNSPRTDIIAIPSQPGNSPFQAHLFVNNEGAVSRETIAWLNAVGFAAAPALTIDARAE